ncbi:MAG TPA: YdeI/OmpD-associated family protein [Saprospiraceae bacterium]|nr:YdeI/OmpD-associated family protein [Saprospiraceae bacterium]HQW54730.1 YdeI/OmpD-associated family protein [Saprospiraceae bacterium]
MNSKANWYFERSGKWQEEIGLLRTIILECQLSEDLKWGVPTYTYKKANIVLIHTFKEYCAILFPKGVLLKDKKSILIQQTENVQSARQMRFINVQEITKLKKAIQEYIFEACEVEAQGLKVELKKTADYEVPEEFQIKLDKSQALKSAFEALTPGRQRAYLFYFSQAKQSKTREERVNKYIDAILAGKGKDD